MAAAPMLRVLEREIRVYRRVWRGSVFTTVAAPLLFLGSIGVGLGGLISQRSGSVGGLSYLAFVAPGLLAASAVQTAAADSLWPVMAGHKWMRFYHGIVATPVGPADVYGGLVLWIACRSLLSTAIFVVVAAALGGVVSGWAVFAVPAAVLGALAFACPLAAFAATQDSDLPFSLILRLAIVPLFLFSGTFFPVSQFPDWAQPLIWFSPLWHAVELCRAATTGSAGAIAIAHLAVLAGCIAAGWRWGAHTFLRRLAP